MKKLILAGLLCGLLCSCSHRLVDFTLISTKNVPLERTEDLVKADTRVKGQDSKGMILSIPLGVPNMKEAIDRAIESYPGAVALSDGVVYSKGWTCFFYGKSKYVVEGTPVYLNGNSPANTGVQPAVRSGAPAAAPAAVQLVHEVQPGETLASIAGAYKVSVRDLLTWNRLASNVVEPGSRLIVYLQ